MDDSVVIVGAGQAGVETAVALRNKGFTGTVTVLGDESGVPYQRPPLSKAYLKGGADPDELALRPQVYFDKHDIDVRCLQPVTAIDRQAATVTLQDGEELGYQHLVLATGTRNRCLPVPGAALPKVLYLRTLAEADDLARQLRACTSVVVIGAGFIGLEVAAAAASHGAHVTVIEALSRPMARALSVPMSLYFTDLHARNGVELLLSTAVREIVEKDGAAAAVVTGTGERIEADLIVVGIGVEPNTDLARSAQLPVNNGIAVDRRLRTADPRIFAVGDCASFPVPGSSRRRVRLESVQNAVDHARCVASQITGTETEFDAVPWFWTEQFDAKLQMAGLLEGHDKTVIRGDVDSGAFSVFGFAGGRLVAVESVNRPRDHMAARKLLAGHVQLTPEQAQDPAFDLKATALAR